MKRLVLAAVLLVIPLALFAQASGSTSGAQRTPQGREREALLQLGLADAQVTQVLDIQTRTHDSVRLSAAQLRVYQAQIDQAMLANPVDLKAVNALVDQSAQTRASMRKTLLAARAQLQQIMGIDNFQVYMRGVRQAMAHRFQVMRSRGGMWNGMQGPAMRGPGMQGPGAGGGMGDDGGWM